MDVLTVELVRHLVVKHAAVFERICACLCAVSVKVELRSEKGKHV